MLGSLQFVSIAIELIIALFGLFIYFKRDKIYGLGIFLTFTIYVFYDYVKLKGIVLSSDLLYVLFFIASASMLWVVIKLYKNKK